MVKRLIRKSNENYIDKYGLNIMEEIEQDVGSWISGGGAGSIIQMKLLKNG